MMTENVDSSGSERDVAAKEPASLRSAVELSKSIELEAKATTSETEAEAAAIYVDAGTDAVDISASGSTVASSRVITGRVEPPLQGVTITIFRENRARKDSAEALEVEIGTVQTDSTGQYSTAESSTMALEADQTYVVNASKAGYHFKRDRDGSTFKHWRLSEVDVGVVKAAWPGEGLKAVELSISRQQPYLPWQKFSARAETSGGGHAIFPSLLPGNYRIEAQHPEYVFHPPSIDIQVKEGAEAAVGFLAQRAVFSASGVVTSAGGEPLNGLLVQAVPVTPSGPMNATVDANSTAAASRAPTDLSDATDVVLHAWTIDNGTFRVPGLTAKTSWALSVKINGTLIDRVTPQSIRVDMGNEDVHGIQFFASEPTDRYGVSGTVSIERVVPENQTAPALPPASAELVLTPLADGALPSAHSSAANTSNETLGSKDQRVKSNETDLMRDQRRMMVDIPRHHLFEFSDLAPGNYSLRVSVPAFNDPDWECPDQEVFLFLGSASPRIEHVELRLRVVRRERKTIFLQILRLMCLALVFLSLGRIVGNASSGKFAKSTMSTKGVQGKITRGSGSNGTTSESYKSQKRKGKKSKGPLKPIFNEEEEAIIAELTEKTGKDRSSNKKGSGSGSNRRKKSGR